MAELLDRIREIAEGPAEVQGDQGRVKQQDISNLIEADKYVEAQEAAGTLSYGQQKLLTLACCLATDARILLLDEPVAGVHPEMAEKILGLLQRLHAAGQLIVFIEHDIPAVKQIAERVVVMDHGKVIADGPPGTCWSVPRFWRHTLADAGEALLDVDSLVSGYGKNPAIMGMAEARKQLDEARKKARAERETADKQDGLPRRKLGDPLDGLEDRLSGIGDVLARKISVTGTLNAVAVQGLGAGDAVERTARATEQTAKHTKRLAESATAGGLRFA